MKQYLSSPLILTALVLIGAVLLTMLIMAITKPPTFSDDAEVTVRIDQAKVRAEVAVSLDKQAKGLMGHKPLLDDEGLLFVYAQPTRPRFWMKDVPFSIDIIWISGKTVSEVTRKVPSGKKDVPDEDLPRYKPMGPIDKVLEVPAGWADQHSVQPGDPVKFSR